jgi:hypothetical protein
MPASPDPARVRRTITELRDIAGRCADGARLDAGGLQISVTTVRFMAPEMPLGPSYGSDPVPVIVVGGEQVADTGRAYLPRDVPTGSILDLGRAGRSNHLRQADWPTIERLAGLVESGELRRVAEQRGVLGEPGRERGATWSLPGI